MMSFSDDEDGETTMPTDVGDDQDVVGLANVEFEDDMSFLDNVNDSLLDSFGASGSHV